MHKIDTNGHVTNLFDSGDPNVPRLPTQVDKHWLNAVQEELMTLLTEASVVPVKGTWNQVLASLRALFVRTTGGVAQSVTGRLLFKAAGAATFATGLRLAIEEVSVSVSDYAANIYSQFGRALNLYGGRSALHAETGHDGSVADVAAVITTANGGAYGIIARAAQTSPVRSALRIVPQVGLPSSAQMGDLYVNAADGKLYIYGGSPTPAWVVVGSQS